MSASGAEQALIEARGIAVRYGARLVLDHVDISLRPREIVTLIGLNGAGKSTLVRALLGLITIDEVLPPGSLATRQTENASKTSLRDLALRPF